MVPAHFLRSLSVVLTLAVWAGYVGEARAEPKKWLELIDKMNKPVTIDRGIDPNTPLKDALDFLSDRYDLTIIVNTSAWEEYGMREAETFPVKLPKLVGISLRKVLQLLLDQVDGIYLVRFDHIEIVPKDHVRARLGMKVEKPRVPRVDYVAIDNKPLGEALEKLATTTKTTVLLDARGREIAKMPVKAEFRNVLLRDAVRVLADMADLKAVALGQGFYVTTRANADAMQAEQKEPAPKEPIDPLPLPPLVNGKIDKVPLAEALEQLADQTEVSVVLEHGAGETLVFGVFKNTPLEDAVRVLADMADLKTVKVGDVLYVTTRAKADALEAEQEKRNPPKAEQKKKAEPKKPEPAAPEDLMEPAK